MNRNTNLIKTCGDAMLRNVNEGSGDASTAMFAKNTLRDMDKFKGVMAKRTSRVLNNRPKGLNDFSESIIHMGIDSITTEYVKRALELKKWAHVKNRWSAVDARDYIHQKILAREVNAILHSLTAWASLEHVLKFYKPQ